MKSGPGLYRAANSQLVAVADRNAERAEDFARRHGVARWHDDAEAIIRAPDVDIVYIATMTESHRDLVLRCAAAGKPVLTEKPMAMTHADCLAMIAACRDAKVPLWVAYYRRALPRFLKVRELVQGGAIGDVRMVITRHFQRIPDAGGRCADRSGAGGSIPRAPAAASSSRRSATRSTSSTSSSGRSRACARSPTTRRAPIRRRTS